MLELRCFDRNDRICRSMYSKEPKVKYANPLIGSMAVQESRRGEDCAIQGYFKGTPRNETAKKCNISTGQVSIIWKDLETTIGNGGTATRELAIDLRKEGCTVAEAAIGAQLYSIFVKLKIELKGVEDFAEKFYSASVKKRVSPDALVELAYRIFEVEKSTGPF